MKVKNDFIDQQEARTKELKGLIANHDCRLGPDNECVCIAWIAELNGEQYE